jgi:signal transduction histidine kinase
VLDEARIAANEDLPEAIGFIRSSTTKMDGLINAILKLSRAGRRAARAERVELRSFFDAAVASVQHQLIDANGRVDLSISAPPISSDRLSLEQIFGNLIDNAVKYRAPGRPLRVDVRAATAPGNQVTIEIADNGRGISDQDKERVFELFRRSGVQDQPGEGIGLAYVRTLVRNLGGDITMKSVLGEGTTFTVTLPRTLKTVGSTAA